MECETVAERNRHHIRTVIVTIGNEDDGVAADVEEGEIGGERKVGVSNDGSVEASVAKVFAAIFDRAIKTTGDAPDDASTVRSREVGNRVVTAYHPHREVARGSDDGGRHSFGEGSSLGRIDSLREATLGQVE